MDNQMERDMKTGGISCLTSRFRVQECIGLRVSSQCSGLRFRV